MISAIDMKSMDKERQARIFESMIEAFLNRYKPTDRYEASEFERDLHMLVRQIYRDAQDPLLDHITKLISAMPMMPFAAGPMAQTKNDVP